jgi:hypothetical protein
MKISYSRRFAIALGVSLASGVLVVSGANDKEK